MGVFALRNIFCESALSALIAAVTPHFSTGVI